ncbi:ubiquitin domain-containing protein DSK2a-like [Camellia sinensis]|uniref:ubiquitin domain-containing protein DSK2a-like n=1 Tax=Camellia sinensis TaxID=4442 RepID=UPI0010358FAA|nr:ubiquitin domain-containing protein DSK2a-like [Camellia sinensis]
MAAGGAQTNSTTRSNPAEDARLPAVGGLGGLGLPEMFGSTQDTASLSQFMQNPAVSQMMQSLLSNPQYMNQILGLNSQQSNMLGSNSQLREMMQNPEFIRQLTSPETMQVHCLKNLPLSHALYTSFYLHWKHVKPVGEQVLVSGRIYSLASLVIPPIDLMLLFCWNLSMVSSTIGNSKRVLMTVGVKLLYVILSHCGCATFLPIVGTLDNMGLEMLMNMFGGLGIGSPAVSVRSDVPPEELYATQLSQLQEMGFFDTRENIQALIATAGNVHAAVERLLGNPGQ